MQKEKTARIAEKKKKRWDGPGEISPSTARVNMAMIDDKIIIEK